jgi:hypothetical protein
MAWPKGQSRGEKTGGRKVGTPNRRAEELRTRIEELLGGRDLPTVILFKIKKLPIEDQVQVLMGLMPYVYPRLKDTEVRAEVQSMTFTDFVKAASMAKEGRNSTS